MEDSFWNQYNQWNIPDPRMTRLWNETLSDWILKNEFIRSNVNAVLDYGCGYFDLGKSISNSFATVDGFDPNPDAIGTARKNSFNANSRLFQTRDAIPQKHYELVVLNSVTQYLIDENGFESFLRFASTLLKNDGSILLTDLMPTKFNMLSAAFQSLMLAKKRGLLIPWSIHFFKVKFKPKKYKLFHIDFENLKLIAMKNGFNAQKLDENLTPAKLRYSVFLKKFDSSSGPDNHLVGIPI